MVEVQDKMMSKMYGRIEFKFMTRLVEVRGTTLNKFRIDQFDRLKAVQNVENFSGGKGSSYRQYQRKQRTSESQRILRPRKLIS